MKITLARPEPRYVRDILAYGRDPEFCRFLDSSPFEDAGQAEAFLAQVAEDNAAGDRDYWIIVDTDAETAIGTIGFIFPAGRERNIADLGFGISPAYWGTGAFQESVAQVMAYGFETLGLDRVNVTTRADNQRSIRGIKKAGFREEALLPDFYEDDTGTLDGMLLCLSRETA